MRNTSILSIPWITSLKPLDTRTRNWTFISRIIIQTFEKKFLESFYVLLSELAIGRRD